jgi:hypothetical protein
MLHRIFLFVVSTFLVAVAYAQTQAHNIDSILRSHIYKLTAHNMMGRGYVGNGQKKAATYIHNLFTQLGMSSTPGITDMQQSYSFPVNTFPGKMNVAINGKELSPGQEYLVDAASASYNSRKTIAIKDLAAITTTQQWKYAKATLSDTCIWLLLHTDSMCRSTGIPSHQLPSLLPSGCYIIPQKSKLMWTVAEHTNAATVIYIPDSSLPHLPSIASVNIKATLKEKFVATNIVACVPGTLPDSFIVFSAHYDHLGMMGSQAVFPGASDNASGTAMLLYLAQYYAAHPQRYTMVFIAFSGEEAGLLGSAHFVQNPPFPLGAIKMLCNLDIMGDATDGVTVVNATMHPKEYELLTSLNEKYNYLPVIKSRGKAANSDQYYFSKAGVPAFFIYSNGGKGYYHDIYDKPEAVTLNNIPSVANLLINFVADIQ